MTTLRTFAAAPRPGRTRRRVLYRWLTAVIGTVALAGGIVAVAWPAAAAVNTWTMISAGKSHTCGIKTDTTLWCWGANNSGQLGIGNFEDQNTPAAADFGTAGWTWVSAGNDFTCGVFVGYRECWGANGSGQLGLGNYVNQNIPSILPGEGHKWARVDAGERHACGITSNPASGGLASAVCWGANGYGQLGTGGYTSVAVPTPVALPGHRWRAISAGSDHTCAVDTTSYRFCWGIDDTHQLGMVAAGTDPQVTPFHDPGDGQYFAVDSGDGTSCVIPLSTRWLECYGKNTYGNIGNGSTEPTDDTISYGQWAATSSGGYHACSVDLNGTTYCWGHNSAGQLGLGNNTEQLSLGPPLPRTFAKVSAGFMHTCGIDSSQLLYCWGYNVRGQLGIGSLTNVNTPNPVL